MVEVREDGGGRGVQSVRWRNNRKMQPWAVGVGKGKKMGRDEVEWVGEGVG